MSPLLGEMTDKVTGQGESNMTTDIRLRKIRVSGTGKELPKRVQQQQSPGFEPASRV
jgi:hypothetical protein